MSDRAAAPAAKPSAPSDGELMIGYLGGSLDSLRELVVRHTLPLYTFFWAMVGEPGLAEELSRACWLDLHRSRRSYRPPQPLVTWLYGRAVQLRRESMREAVVQASQPGAARTITDADSLLRALHDLPDSYREVVVLERIVGLPRATIAELLGTTLATVETRAAPGYQQLGAHDSELSAEEQQLRGKSAVAAELLIAAVAPTAMEHTIRELLPAAARDLETPPRPWLLLGALLLVFGLLIGFGVGWLELGR
jgi:DNA-directed RNA polymerase specialized sigma24 family protein